MTQPRSIRKVAGIVPATHTFEGAGFEVARPFPTSALEMLDPYLLLDEMGPTIYAPGEAQGAPDHPHRGFETVTYILDGEFEHRDSRGNHGVIRAGDVQWMTAGDGIVHSEMPSHAIQEHGGRVHGFQIWINLPRANKRATPRYQSITAPDLTTVEGPLWSAKIIAGSLLGVEGPAATHNTNGAAKIIVEPGGSLEINLAADHTAGVYAFGGSGVVGTQRTPLPERSLAVHDRGEGSLLVAVAADAAENLEALVLTGRPIDEPVARYGPFVMNSRDELIEAFEDFQAGTMGSIVPAGTA